MAKKASKAERPKTIAKENKDSNLLAAIAYFLGVFAVILYIIKKDDKFVKFHSVQSILLNIALLVIFMVLGVLSTLLSIITLPLGGIGGLAWFCTIPVALVMIVIILYGAWKAFQGEMWHIPYIGEWADKYA